MNCVSMMGHHDHELNDSRGQPGSGRHWRVQIDLHPARAIPTHPVCASLAGRELESAPGAFLAGIEHAASHRKIPLCELAGAVEVSNCHTFDRACGPVGIRLIPINGEAVIALESGVAAAVVL